MIAPAVLISGVGILLMRTSSRLGRATDRVRTLTARFNKVLVTPEGQREALAKQEKRMILGQLPRLSRRTQFLQRAMQSLYLAVSLLVRASIWIGAASLLFQSVALRLVLLAIAGAATLAYSAVLLSIESGL